MSIVNKYVFDICFKFHVLTLVTLGLKRQQSTSNWTSTSYQAWWFWHFSLCDLLSLASRRRRHRNPQRGVKEGIQTKWIFQYSFFHLLIWFLFFPRQKEWDSHQKASERFHAVHERNEASGAGRVHVERVCSHQPATRSTGETTSLDIFQFRVTDTTISALCQSFIWRVCLLFAICAPIFLKLSWETGLVWEIKTKVKKLICLAVARSKSGRTSQVLREGSSWAAKAHANVSPLERSWQLPIWLQKEEAETGEVGGDCLS